MGKKKVSPRIKKGASSGPSSMTGFGAAARAAQSVRVEVEIKSANSRFLDLTIKAPRLYAPLESEVRELVAETVQRGRVEVLVGRVGSSVGARRVSFNRELFEVTLAVYLKQFRGAGIDSPEARAGAIRDVLSRHEILEVAEGEVSVTRERAVLLGAVRHALVNLESMRRSEGARLVADLETRLNRLVELRSAIARQAAATPAAARKRLAARIERLAPSVQIDPERLAAEVAIIADRVDVTEELVRLESHVAQFRKELKSAAAGKKLDFLLQEFGREFNTIGSKAQDAVIQAAVVDAKAEMEKMREQVQNLE